LPQNAAWALAKNAAIVPILLVKYPPGHGYWPYLDSLVADLRAKNCNGVQEKMTDVANNIKKFEAAVSELEIARLLAAKGKKVSLLPDSFLPSKSPDILVADSNGESYVEVTRFSDDDASGLIIDELRRLLDDPSRRYRVDVSLPEDLSMPVTDHAERQLKEEKARQVVEKFRQELGNKSLTKLPVDISVDGVTFRLSPSTSGGGYPGVIHHSLIVVPSGKYVDRIRYLVTWKAEKRVSWTGVHLKKPYVVAIDCEQAYVDEEDVVEAVLGSRTIEHIMPPREVMEAADRNWRSYLEEVHMIPKDRTYFMSYGVFLSKSICKHVSGVLFRREQKAWFVPNPFASDEINDSRLVNFLA
jgi:hypothetical protein